MKLRIYNQNFQLKSIEKCIIKIHFKIEKKKRTHISCFNKTDGYFNINALHDSFAHTHTHIKSCPKINVLI